MEPILIPLEHLAFALIPVTILFFFYFKWSIGIGKPIYAILRMLIQLLLIGYFLTYLFELNHFIPVLLVLLFMVIVASFIAINSVDHNKFQLFKYTFIALILGAGFTLFIVTQAVLNLDPWYLPQYMIPLAGMVFANAMSSISLVAERFFSETNRGVPFEEARNIAFQASMIPTVNSLFAVGLVSLPGMMTGQVLAGVDPLIAARYQIMVMLMLLGATGLSSAIFLSLLKRK